MHNKNTLLLTTVLMLGSTTTHAEITPTNESHWWNGFSITPGAGFRHLGIKVIRKSDDYFGNISNAGFAQGVLTLNMRTPAYKLNDSGMFKLELNTYSAFLNLDHQFYADVNATSSSSGNSGNRVDVGTELTGNYTYILPTLKYELGSPDTGRFAFGLGVGFWSSHFSGDIILTPDEQPYAGLPADQIDFSSNKEAAYMVTLSWTTTGNWIWLMTVSGSNASDNTYNYELVEVSIILGKQFDF